MCCAVFGIGILGAGEGEGYYKLGGVTGLSGQGLRVRLPANCCAATCLSDLLGQ